MTELPIRSVCPLRGIGSGLFLQSLHSLHTPLRSGLWVLYDGGMISGSAAGSILHWIIRLIVFVVIWAVTYFVIWLAKLIFAHWLLIVSILGGILVTAAIICLIVRYTRKGGENNA